MPVRDWYDYLSEEGKRRWVAYDPKMRDKSTARRWGICWMYSKLAKVAPWLRFDERVTTIGRTIWLAPKFYNAPPMAQAQTVEHELHHMAQATNWLCWYHVSYVLVLPIGLSMRGVWEAAAFLRGYKLIYKYTRRDPVEYANTLTETLCGKPYLYALWLVKPIVRRVLLRKLKAIAEGK